MNFSPDHAAAFFLAYLRQHGPSPSEDMVAAAVAAGIAPESNRRFGPVFQYLVRQNVIKHVDFKTRKTGNHGRYGRVWGLVE